MRENKPIFISMNHKLIPIESIEPSPFQHRKHFDSGKLKELGKSIERDGLLQPITVRAIGGGFELIAGERRWRAIKDTQNEIEARILDVDDITARRLCAAENIQRDDLSAVEIVGATVEIIDSEMVEDTEYAALGDDASGRVGKLLARLHTAATNKPEVLTPEAVEFSHKFVTKVEAIFSNLPKPRKWHSFYKHDLKLKDIDKDVERWAVSNKLNKSQTKELDKAVKSSPELKEKLKESEDDDGKIGLGVDDDGEEKTIRDLSAKEIKWELSNEPREVERVEDANSYPTADERNVDRLMRLHNAIATFEEHTWDIWEKEIPRLLAPLLLSHGIKMKADKLASCASSLNKMAELIKKLD